MCYNRQNSQTVQFRSKNVFNRFTNWFSTEQYGISDKQYAEIKMGVKSHKVLKHGYNITHIDEKHLNIIPFTGDLILLSYHQECSDVLLLKQVPRG